MGCAIYKIPPYKHIFSYIKTLKNIFGKNNYTIVHSHMSTISVFTLLAAKLADVPVRISHSHVTAGKGKGELFRNAVKYFLRFFSKLFPTHLFACSEYAGKWMFGKKTFDKGKITVLNNAVDLSKFTYNNSVRNTVRNSLHLKDQFVIGNVGRFMPQKNHDFLIDIFFEICKKDNNCTLLLVGDGELKPLIQKKVKKFNLQNNVLFMGIRDDVNELYQAMDVFVLPSLYEGLGMVAVEAQIAGLPTIVSSRVPIEAKVFDFIDFLDLHEGANKWAEMLISKRNFKRLDTSGEPSAKKFSIIDEVKNLEGIYGQMLERELR
jgi:glycosyltransferase EpsF